MDKISINTVLLKKPLADLADKQVRAAHLATLRSWLLCWEIYLIVLVAAFLRLYQISASEYDNDHANLFQLASDAVTHGLIPATANVSSNLFRFLSFANITTQQETLYTPDHKTYLTTDVPILPNSSPKTPNTKPPA